MYSPLHHVVSDPCVLGPHVHHCPARSDPNPHHHSITTKCTVVGTQEGIRVETAMTLEEHTKVVSMLSFNDRNFTVVDIWLKAKIL